MRNMYTGLAVLLLALALSLWSTGHTNALTDEMQSLVTASQESALTGDTAAAAENLLRAADIWEAEEQYTHVFIRHTEVIAVADALYDLLGSVLDGDNASADGGYEKLRYHLESIRKMEQISWGSVF